MSSGEIVLVRHGETEWSAAGQHTSQTDLPLIEEGRERARELGRALADSVTSPWFSAARCAARARPASWPASATRRRSAEDLREWDYGDYEGLTTAEIREERPDWFLWRDGCPGGETPSRGRGAG